MEFARRKELKIMLYRCDDCPYIKWYGYSRDTAYCTYGQEPDDTDFGKLIYQIGGDDEEVEVPEWCPLPDAKP